MKFGMILPTFGEVASRKSIVSTALAAERMGYDSIWVTDHVSLPQADADRFGTIYEAIATLSFLAGVTYQIKLGISSLVLPQRNPVIVAKEIATIDALSDGRVILAAGIGWSAGEYANLGQNFQNRARRMDEALQLLRTLWRDGNDATFQGKYYRVEHAVLLPLPAQAGGPALWVAGNSNAALYRAAKYADGWHPNLRSPEILTAALETAREMIGSRPFTVSLRAHVTITDDPEGKGPLAGTPDQIRENLRAHQQAGANYFILDFDARSQAEQEQNMQTFQKEIMAGWKD